MNSLNFLPAGLAAALALVPGLAVPRTAVGRDPAPPAAPGNQSAVAEPRPAAPSGQSDAGAPGNPAPAGPPAIQDLGGGKHKLGEIAFDAKTRAIIFPGKINLNEGLMEYVLVHESGKVHESLLSTEISPYDLNVVLLLLNYQPAKTFFDVSDPAAGAVLVRNPKIGPEAQLEVSVEWKIDNGGLQKVRVEELLLNVDKKQPVSSGPFTYTGSMLDPDGNFMARDTGSIIALYADAAAVFNNPREGNDLDDIWLANPKKIPPKATSVTITLAPVPAPGKKKSP